MAVCAVIGPVRSGGPKDFGSDSSRPRILLLLSFTRHGDTAHRPRQRNFEGRWLFPRAESAANHHDAVAEKCEDRGYEDQQNHLRALHDFIWPPPRTVEHARISLVPQDVRRTPPLDYAAL